MSNGDKITFQRAKCYSHNEYRIYPNPRPTVTAIPVNINDLIELYNESWGLSSIKKRYPHAVVAAIQDTGLDDAIQC